MKILTQKSIKVAFLVDLLTINLFVLMANLETQSLVSGAKILFLFLLKTFLRNISIGKK